MFSQACVKNSVHGWGGHAWQGGVHSREGHAWHGRCAWQGGMHGRGCV